MEIVHATHPSTGRKSKAYASGRTCSEEGCEAKLSIYNSGDKCGTHEEKKKPRTRGKKK